MKERFRQFMEGRYGVDDLGQALNIAIMVLLFIGLFLAPIFSTLALALLIFTYYRMFSRNTEKRMQENRAYLQAKQRVTRWFKTRKIRFQQRNTYRYFKCPSCQQEIRVPKGKGEITITCPKCNTHFEKKS